MPRFQDTGHQDRHEMRSQYVDEAWKRLAAIAQHQQQAQRELLKGLLNQVETDASLPIEERRKIQCSIVNEALQVELDFHIKAQNFQRGWTHLMKLPRKTDSDGMAVKVSPPVDPTPAEQAYQPIRTPLTLPHRHPLLVPKTPGADEEESVPPRADADDVKTTVRPLSGEAPKRKKSRLQGPNSPDSVPVITLVESGSEGDAETPVIHHCECPSPLST